MRQHIHRILALLSPRERRRGYLRQPYDWILNRHSGDLGKSILSEVGQVISGALVPLMQTIAHGAVAIRLLEQMDYIYPKADYPALRSDGLSSCY